MLELWLSGKQWPLGLPKLKGPLPGCAAPSQIRESNLSRRSWRSGGAAAAADSARLGHLSSLSLTQTSLLQLSSIAIGLTLRAGTSGERRAHWLRGAGRSCSDYHISASPQPCATDRSASPRERIRDPEATYSGLRPFSPDARAAGLFWLWPPSPPPPLLPSAPSRVPSRPRRLRPRLPQRCSSALSSWGPRSLAGRVARGAHFLPPVASG
nr:uncharacterized protein LOC101036611 isoform X2 [Saimiri boliviensis boliviensis]